jgi:hypothetical protein
MKAINITTIRNPATVRNDMRHDATYMRTAIQLHKDAQKEIERIKRIGASYDK